MFLPNPGVLHQWEPLIGQMTGLDADLDLVKSLLDNRGVVVEEKNTGDKPDPPKEKSTGDEPDPQKEKNAGGEPDPQKQRTLVMKPTPKRKERWWWTQPPKEKNTGDEG